MLYIYIFIYMCVCVSIAASPSLSLSVSPSVCLCVGGGGACVIPCNFYIFFSGLFVHTPFMSFDVFRVLPSRESLLRGVAITLLRRYQRQDNLYIFTSRLYNNLCVWPADFILVPDLHFPT